MSLRCLTVLLLFSLLACKAVPQTMSRAEPGEPVFERLRLTDVQRPAEYSFQRLSLKDYADYLPDTLRPELLPTRRLRLNYHVMNTSDTLFPMTGKRAYDYVYALAASSNKKLRQNMASWLTPDSLSIPVLPAQIELLVALDPQTDEPAIYEHFDDELYAYVHDGPKRNRSDMTVVRKYNVRPESELNIYFMGPPRETIKELGKPGNSGSGIYLGSAIKVTDVLSRDVPPWSIRQILTHEVGHALGLQHAWTSNDGCPDTPRHANNSWKAPERGPGLTSNNLMDYSPNQVALTPCQIGRMQVTLADVTRQQRGWVIEDWCDYQPQRPVVIDRDTELLGARDFASDIEVRTGATLTVNNRLHLPTGAVIRVSPGATLILGPKAVIHNDCGAAWGGIELGRAAGAADGRVVADPAATLLNELP